MKGNFFILSILIACSTPSDFVYRVITDRFEQIIPKELIYRSEEELIKAGYIDIGHNLPLFRKQYEEVDVSYLMMDGNVSEISIYTTVKTDSLSAYNSLEVLCPELIHRNQNIKLSKLRVIPLDKLNLVGCGCVYEVQNNF